MMGTIFGGQVDELDTLLPFRDAGDIEEGE